MTPETIALKLTDAERAIVSVMRAQTETDTPYCSFRHIADRSGLPVEQVAPAARNLRASGVLHFATGLFDDDGEPYGSGYALTAPLGIQVRDYLTTPTNEGEG